LRRSTSPIIRASKRHRGNASGYRTTFITGIKSGNTTNGVRGDSVHIESRRALSIENRCRGDPEAIER
jgi:hypothetical protein